MLQKVTDVLGCVIYFLLKKKNPEDIDAALSEKQTLEAVPVYTKFIVRILFPNVNREP